MIYYQKNKKSTLDQTPINMSNMARLAVTEVDERLIFFDNSA